MERIRLIKRPGDSHKGDFGHVLIVAGSRGMAGAGILSAHGALRSGAGLVTLAVPKSRQASAVNHLRPEAMTLGLPETKAGTISASAAPQVLEHIRKRRITALVTGPGISRNAETARFARSLLKEISRADTLRGIVLDADGFLALSGTSLLARIGIPVIATPHPGELANFLGVPVSRVQSDRIGTAKKFSKLNRVVTVLKGRNTVVTDGNKTYVNRTGNPGMARGGSGDVLSGMIAALILNVRPPGSVWEAARAGVYLHGVAGDLAAREKTEIGMAAGDIAEKIPAALKKISK